MSDAAPVSGIHHLKIVVSDLQASLSWWQDVTGARRNPDFDHRTADGQLFAHLLEIPGVGPYLELRLDPAAAAAVGSLDPITFAVDMTASRMVFSSGLAGDVLQAQLAVGDEPA